MILPTVPTSTSSLLAQPMQTNGMDRVYGRDLHGKGDWSKHRWRFEVILFPE